MLQHKWLEYLKNSKHLKDLDISGSRNITTDCVMTLERGLEKLRIAK